MDDTRKIIIAAFCSIFAEVYAYSYGYLTLTEYYLTFFGIVVPVIGGTVIWQIFIRKGFSLHFQIEEGNHLREIGFVRFISYAMDKKEFIYKGRSFLINSRHIVWTDSKNKSHLFFPFNNVFAFHPFAKTYSLTNAGDIPNDFKVYLTPEEEAKEEAEEIKIPSDILTPEENKHREEKTKGKSITAIPIEFFTLMKVDAMEFLDQFAGKLMLLRVEASRNKTKPDRSFTFLLATLTLVVGLFIGIVVYPAYTNQTVHATPPVTSNNNTTTTTTSIITSTTQTIPANAKLSGESSIVTGNVTISYSTYANNSTTVTITHTTTK